MLKKMKLDQRRRPRRRRRPSAANLGALSLCAVHVSGWSTHPAHIAVHNVHRKSPRLPSSAPLCGTCPSSTALHLSRASSSEDVSDRILKAIDRAKEGSLPICNVLEKIISSLSDRPNLLLEAPPGAGKTTLVPLALLPEVGHKGKILLVEPRRVAARSAASRMASSLNERVGEATIELIVRGEVRQSNAAQISVITDGILLSMLREDPELTGVAAVLFDEFHERGALVDTGLALCREVQQSLREDLQLIVMSATLLGEDVENGESSLLRVMGGVDKDGECAIVKSEGRAYPVEVTYRGNCRGSPPLSAFLQNMDLLIQSTADAVEEALDVAPEGGDVLVFLPGAREIRSAIRELESRDEVAQNDVDVLPLYGALPRREQDFAINAPQTVGRRRVIVSSPIAEASLTLERVTCVVDSGLRREPRSDKDTGMPRLVTTVCSRASAIQRSGRAGRTREGACIRMYSEGEFSKKLPSQSIPEILSTDLTPIVMMLLDWGVSRPNQEICEDLPFVNPPSENSLERDLTILENIGAVKQLDGGQRYAITDHGRSINKLPMHPRLATCVVGASSEAEVAISVIAAALLDSDAPEGRQGRASADLSGRVRDILADTHSAKRIERYAARLGNGALEAAKKAIANESFRSDAVECLGTALLPGFSDLVAQRRGTDDRATLYKLALGRTAKLSSTSGSPDYSVVVETSTSDGGNTQIISFAPIDQKSLSAIATDSTKVFTEPTKGHKVRARSVRSIGHIELSSTPLPSPPADKIASVLLDTIRHIGGVSDALLKPLAKERRAKVELLRDRVRLAYELSSKEERDFFPPYFAALDAQEEGDGDETDALLLEEMVEPWLWACSSIASLNLHEILMSALGGMGRHLNDIVPERIEAPDGSSINISYTDGVPLASGKLQQFFGATESPMIGPAANAIPVTLSLLSPAGKPLAQTKDLQYFWKDVYPNVRAEMRGRYSKHPWPEDPFTAKATRGTNKQERSKNNS